MAEKHQVLICSSAVCALKNAFFATGVATGTVKLVSVLTGIVSLELLATL